MYTCLCICVVYMLGIFLYSLLFFIFKTGSHWTWRSLIWLDSWTSWLCICPPSTGLISSFMWVLGIWTCAYATSSHWTFQAYFSLGVRLAAALTCLRNWPECGKHLHVYECPLGSTVLSGQLFPRSMQPPCTFLKWRKKEKEVLCSMGSLPFGVRQCLWLCCGVFQGCD